MGGAERFGAAGSGRYSDALRTFAGRSTNRVPGADASADGQARRHDASMNHDHHHNHGSHPPPKSGHVGAMAMAPSHSAHDGMASHAGHASMVDDFRRRFWISMALTIPVLATSEMLQHLLGLRGVLAFPGAQYVEF